MDINGRYEDIGDVLAFLHTGQWFGWSDNKNNVYANLVIYNSDYDKPTEKSLTDALTKQQSDFDAQAYARDRTTAYPSTGDQLDYIYHNGVAKWKTDMIDPVKTKYPKG
jgi:hypothetical protein